VDWRLGEHIQWGTIKTGRFWRVTYNYSDELSRKFRRRHPHVNDERGTITVNVGDGRHESSIRKKVRAEKEQDAENYNSKTKPQITVGDKVVTLNATPDAGDKAYHRHGYYVPHTALVITSGRGDVTIEACQHVEVNHHRGEVNINDHTGNVSLNLDGIPPARPCEGRRDYSG